ncbi:MAG: aminotransferase class I/II-fold pyridoxal phosphate-dependent enzyme, partial [Actinomycetes bacterium]
PSQLRRDAWSELETTMERLADESTRDSALVQAATEWFETLDLLEGYFTFPGKLRYAALRQCFAAGEYSRVAQDMQTMVRYALALEDPTFGHVLNGETDPRAGAAPDSLPFTVLIVDSGIDAEEEALLNAAVRAGRMASDEFVYDVLVVPSFEDAIVAVLLNHDIQACVIRSNVDTHREGSFPLLGSFVQDFVASRPADEEMGPWLGEVIGELRPELDLYLSTNVAIDRIEDKVHERFRRVFYVHEDMTELHMTILDGIRDRYSTPFFDALLTYAQRPTGVFHALPVARGNSLFRSQWMRDMTEFYGRNIFMAETSATTGGLDSLLDPHGPIKEAQAKAARTFGAKRTYWVTNGTSTANKIVVQSQVEPGDIVLIDRNCHKSHHYAMVLGGGCPVYLDSFQVEYLSCYGGVSLHTIKSQLLQLKRAGRLDRVKMLLLTNCTFDGYVYNVRDVMEQVLAIKPDIVFLWDEAWFQFARLHPLYRQRTGMKCADELRKRYDSADYRADYARWKAAFDELNPDDDATWLENTLMPDPDSVRIRVYATHSTHKSLSSLRQGSMIQVWDQDFAAKSEEAFLEAYMTHTSTSPNYQILASLDLARRQVDLEGYALMENAIQSAMAVRTAVNSDPRLNRYFHCPGPTEMIPSEYRPSGFSSYDEGSIEDSEPELAKLEQAWRGDEFVLDPTRVTLYLAQTGIDGYTFRNDWLMAKHDIQVNKTSLNSVLFQTNIGTTFSSVAYLKEVLLRIADELDALRSDASNVEARLHRAAVERLTSDLPPLPDFSEFHEAFRPNQATPEGDMRTPFFLAYNEDNIEYLRIVTGEVDNAMASGRRLVAARFVIPYPPGFPVLVPGQVVSEDILAFMKKLDITEIHGYREELGLPVFTQQALEDAMNKTRASAEG